MNYIAQGATAFATLLCVATPFHASAARLSFGDPVSMQRPASSGAVALPVLVTLDRKECINAADISLAIPQTAFTFLNHDEVKSAFSLWLYSTYDEKNSRFKLVGGNPVPLCGGLLGETFEISRLEMLVNAAGTLSFDNDSAVALSDGLGTNAALQLDTLLLAPRK